MRRTNYSNDSRIVMTLDAGGTNFVFGAVRGNADAVSPVTLPSNAHDLDKCLSTLVEGFSKVIAALKEKPVAISFAFPGPADYVNGIIGDLPNLPAFHSKGGVALGAFLEEKFKLPVFINNDGDLFAYGEAFAGALPELNKEFEAKGIHKQFKNLFGFTLGTGCGGGLVRNGELFLGDNGASAEIWTVRNKKYNDAFAEEGVSIRAVKRVYKKMTGDNTDLSPKDIFDIAEGTKDGNKEAARAAFAELGEVLGDLIANITCVVDGAIVIGGGLVPSHKYFMPAVIKEMNGTLSKYDNGGSVPRLESKAFNMEDSAQKEAFFKGSSVKVKVPYSDKQVDYNIEKRVPVMISKLGASKAISLGAYCFALNSLDMK